MKCSAHCPAMAQPLTDIPDSSETQLVVAVCGVLQCAAVLTRCAVECGEENGILGHHPPLLAWLPASSGATLQLAAEGERGGE